MTLEVRLKRLDTMVKADSLDRDDDDDEGGFRTTPTTSTPRRGQWGAKTSATLDSRSQGGKVAVGMSQQRGLSLDRGRRPLYAGKPIGVDG